MRLVLFLFVNLSIFCTKRKGEEDNFEDDTAKRLKTCNTNEFEYMGYFYKNLETDFRSLRSPNPIKWPLLTNFLRQCRDLGLCNHPNIVEYVRSKVMYFASPFLKGMKMNQDELDFLYLALEYWPLDVIIVGRALIAIGNLAAEPATRALLLENKNLLPLQLKSLYTFKSDGLVKEVAIRSLIPFTYEFNDVVASNSKNIEMAIHDALMNVPEHSYFIAFLEYVAILLTNLVANFHFDFHRTCIKMFRIFETHYRTLGYRTMNGVIKANHSHYLLRLFINLSLMYDNYRKAFLQALAPVCKDIIEKDVFDDDLKSLATFFTTGKPTSTTPSVIFLHEI